MTRARILGAAVFIFAVVLIAIFLGSGSLRDLATIRQLVERLTTYSSTHNFAARLIYFCVYLLAASFAIPVSLFLTLLGGALFGVIEGSILSWLACSLGATVSFLIARYALGDYLIERFKKKLHLARQSFAADGLFYLFSLRLIPGFPFILANFLMALLPIRTISFFLVTLAGTLPLTVVYTNAGFRLAEIKSLEGILQPSLIFSLVAVGLAPLTIKKLFCLIKRRPEEVNV